MPLIFNKQPYTNYQQLLKDNTPKGKSKTVSFVLCDANPFIRLTEKGQQVSGRGGIAPLSTTCLAKIDGITAELTYYDSSAAMPGKFGNEINYEPKYLHFNNFEMMVDAVAQPERLVYVLLNRFNESNSLLAGVNPLYRMIDISDSKSKAVVSGKLKGEAFKLIEAAFEKNKAKVCAIYVLLGGNDVKELKKAKEWDSILAPLYALADKDPKKLIDYMDSAALDVGAKVREAIEEGVLREDSGGFYWATNGKKIWTAPAGKGEEAFDLFVDWLRNVDKSSVFKTIEDELLTILIQEAQGV